MNSIFSSLGNIPMFGNVQNFTNQFNKFRNTFNGDPQTTINNMLQNGQLSQAQLEQAKQMANQIQRMLK